MVSVTKLLQYTNASTPSRHVLTNWEKSKIQYYRSVLAVGLICGASPPGGEKSEREAEDDLFLRGAMHKSRAGRFSALVHRVEKLSPAAQRLPSVARRVE